MKKKTNGPENRFTKFIKTRRKWVTALVVLAVIIAGATFWVLRYNGEAATYKKRILECTAIPGMVSHIHNDDCYQAGMLVCPLPEIEPHEHTDSCYMAVLSCTLPENDGHHHTEACYFTEKQLICGMEESEEHQHSEECYAENTLLICGMEEGEGAHYHTDACYEQVLICDKPVLPVHIHGPECFRIEEMTIEEIEEGNTEETAEAGAGSLELTAPVGEVQTEVQAGETVTEETPEASQEQMDAEGGEEAAGTEDIQASDEMGNSTLDETAENGQADTDSGLNSSAEENTEGIIPADAARDTPAGQETGSAPEGEESAEEPAGNPDQGNLEETPANEAEKTEPSPGTSEKEKAEEQPEMVQASVDARTGTLSFTAQAGDVLVLVEADAGTFPEGTEMKVSPVYDEKVLGDAAGAVEGKVLHVQAVDISFWHEGEEIEPVKPIRVTMTPAEMPETGTSKQEVIHIDHDGEAAVVAQEKSAETEVIFEADSFSAYAIVHIELE